MESCVKDRFTYDFFVVSKFEVILNHIVLVLLDVILVKLPLLDLLKVPGYHIISGRGDYRILFLAFSLVKPRNQTVNGVNIA